MEDIEIVEPPKDAGLGLTSDDADPLMVVRPSSGAADADLLVASACELPVTERPARLEGRE